MFLLALFQTKIFQVQTVTHLDSNSRISSMSGDGQFQGATVFKALVQWGIELYSDGVGVIRLGVGLMAAHDL